MSEWNPAFDGARVSADAEIGEDVEIGVGTVVYPGVRLGDRCRIGPYCLIGEKPVVLGDDVTVGAYCELGHPAGQTDRAPLKIGNGSHIRSHSVFYEGSVFGEQLVTGHRVTVREGTKAGAGLQLGTLSDVQGKCTLGDYVKTHSNVHICQAATIEDYVWIYPYVVLTNDPHPPSDGFIEGPLIRRYAVIATHACVMPAVQVGEDSLVAAGAMVTRDVTPRTVVAGVPAREICRVEKMELKDASGQSAYPWRRHFRRGYPGDTVAEWEHEFPDG